MLRVQRHTAQFWMFGILCPSHSTQDFSYVEAKMNLPPSWFFHWMVWTESCWAEVLPAPAVKPCVDTGQDPWASPGPLQHRNLQQKNQRHWVSEARPSIPAKPTPRLWLAPAVGAEGPVTLPGAWQQRASLTETLRGSEVWDFPADRKQR